MGLLLKLLLGLLDGGGQREKEAGKRARLEQDMEAYGLSEEEKGLVRSGDYDPWDFEEEEMDEDSYYSDDT